MKNKKKISIISISLFLLIITYIIISIYINNNFSFKLAEIHFFLSKENFINISKQFSDIEKYSYLFMALTLDILWPVTYSLFFFFINIKVYKHKKNLNMTNLIIFSLFLSDMIENFSTLKYLYSNNSSYIYISIFSTNIKWLLFITITLISIYRIIKFSKTQSIKKLFYN